VIALAIVQFSGLHAGIQNTLVDLRFGWLQRDATGNVVIVAIDTRSIEAVGAWPWSRQLHADLLRQLEKAGARDIAFDVDFSSSSENSADRAFSTALQGAGGSTVLPTFKQLRTTNSNDELFINRPLKQFRDFSWPAVVNVSIETDGLVRRYSFGEVIEGTFTPSMAAILAGRYSENKSPFSIDFGIRPTTLPTVSFSDVLRGDPQSLRTLKDKKVIVGATAIELGDRFSIPKGRVVPGPILQGLATESMLQGRDLRQTSNWISIAVVLLIAGLMLVVWRRLSAGARVALLLSLATVVEVLAVLIQRNLPVIFDTALISVAIAAYLIAVALDELDFRQLVSRVAERRFQKIAMSLGDGVVCFDSKQSVTLWNPGAAAMFGHDAADAQGKSFESICGLSNPITNAPFKISDIDVDRYQAPGGETIELQARRKDGIEFPVEACFSGWSGTDGFHFGAVLRDITLRKREAARIRRLAEYDALTGLPNRHSLIEYLSSAMNCNRPTVIVLVGLDKFQHINDMWGNASGDLVLCSVADRLKNDILGRHFLARLSGDKFAIVLNTPAAGELPDLCGRIRSVFETPFSAGVRSHSLTVSIGTAAFPIDGSLPEDLLGNSHLALRQSKFKKDQLYVPFQSGFRTELETRLSLETELADAYAQNQFELFFQPQVRLSDSHLIGAEALIRWRHPVRGLVSPAQFMPVVNASSISNAVGNWVLRTACAQARTWEEAGVPVRIGVNLSPSHLLSGNLLHSVEETLRQTQLSPRLLELEVTEDILISDEKAVLRTFSEIQKLGVRIVFDDFGTGYASLSYLKKFPLDGLKIDRSFVSSLSLGSEDRAIVAATIDLSKQLGLSIIAEGIENRETADLLLKMGCKQGQGYFYGRPMTSSEFASAFIHTPVPHSSALPEFAVT
jgi:diguanylate cyclase (GGDEF)-like protein/PAS domain S-box-containing protein